MIELLRARLRQGHRTLAWPDGPAPELPDRFRGAPEIAATPCAAGEPPCAACAEACPTEAIALDPRPRLELGRCLFCGECAGVCPTGTLALGRDPRLAARRRADLVVDEEHGVRLATALDREARRLFGRSLRLRQVSAGGCNACESEVNVLSTVVWDVARFGIQVVASPRHADGLLVTGPVSANMRLALRRTWEAVPPPRLVVAVGACAISGGVFRGHPEVEDGADSLLPVDLYVPGCPPHPLTILDGLLRLLGRLDGGGR